MMNTSTDNNMHMLPVVSMLLIEEAVLIDNSS